MSVGFGGEVKVWARTQKQDEDGPAEEWTADGEVKDNVKAGELWAPALSHEGRYLAATTHDGRMNVWDLESENGARAKIRSYETKGSFGLCCDMVVFLLCKHVIALELILLLVPRLFTHSHGPRQWLRLRLRQ